MSIYWDRPCYKCRSHTCDMSCPEPDHLAELAKKDAEIARLVKMLARVEPLLAGNVKEFEVLQTNERLLRNSLSKLQGKHTKLKNEYAEQYSVITAECGALKAENLGYAKSLLDLEAEVKRLTAASNAWCEVEKKL